MSASDPPQDRISSFEANHWWRQNTPEGALLNKLMLLFIAVPIALVWKNFYVLSFAVFALMIPYGLLVRRLAVRAALRHLHDYPDDRENFQRAGILSD